MKKYCFLILVLVLILFSCADKPGLTGEIAVDMAQKGADVPSSMYGVFFEEINHAGDGGLYAELVQNRGFEEKEHPEGYWAEGNKLHPVKAKNHLTGVVSTSTYRWNEEECPAWSLVSEGYGEAKMELTKSNPLNTATPNSLKITIPETVEKVSLINSGYWGMGVYSGERYNLRFYLRAPAYNGSVEVRLISSEGEVLSEAKVEINNSPEWNEYKMVLVPDKTDSKAELAICFVGAGQVWVDYVSLFPENTYKNRPNGLRKDVAQFLEDMHPAFVRWPGGCVVEGITLNNRVEWKKTLGDPMTRSGEYDTWGYRNTYGFGYHEFLQYCEDVGAEGMFVCNIGFGCQARSGDACKEEEVQFYIDDVLDAIEYAIGDESTKWGAKRIVAGHKEAFPLQYVEIGNENWGSVYDKRFDIFYNAIKTKYPQLTLISNHILGDGVKNVAKTDMIDPHWYVAPDFFFKNADIFDNQPRGDYKVYVGEYACNRDVGGGNMLAALSEAAFITGMERNSDLVTMASYAPLFENSNDRTWPVNLIWINNMQVVGRSSYYVQKMMAENRPDYNLNTSLKPKPLKPLSLDTEGAVGVGTWRTQAEYKDFRITTADRTINEPKMEDWLRLSEDWTVSDSLISQDSNNTMTGLLWDESFTDKYTYELKARKKGGNEGFLIYFGMSDQNKNGYLFNIGGWGNTQTAVESVQNGSTTGAISGQVSQKIENDKWYNIKLVVSENEVDLWIDDSLMLKYNPVSVLHQFAVAGYDEAAGELIIKVVNADETTWHSAIKINNGAAVSADGKIITLSADSPEDENSFQEPFNISPKMKTYSKFSSSFEYDFEPFSLTVLRIKTAKHRL